jgi:hypothetical protein
MEAFVSKYFCVLHLGSRVDNFAYLVYDTTTGKRVLTTSTDRVMEILLSNLVAEQTVDDYSLVSIRIKKCMNDIVYRFFDDQFYVHKECVVWELCIPTRPFKSTINSGLTWPRESFIFTSHSNIWKLHIRDMAFMSPTWQI